MDMDEKQAKDAKAARAAAAKARKEARRAFRRSIAAETEALGLPADTAVDIAASKSNANRPLPAPPPNLPANSCTICLFYQYKEPAWSNKQHKSALHHVTELARTHHITGRGRCAPEGLNCTLTASANDMRAFCYALREWDEEFQNTDFKLEDGIHDQNRFRTFTLRKTTELVGYTLDGIRAPSLNRHAGKHLDAMEYHAQMQQKDTVIIDVRNAYESDIGHFQPPEGGAQLLDPKMRTSGDFPKWLHDPSTKEKLQNKTVMMYCTGGIRCERATALLNQMTEASDEFETKGVVMVRGGIERYLKTYKEGGYWKGKNYLFDKRMDQAPPEKSQQALEKDVESHCCICEKKYAQYRGQHKCAHSLPSGLQCSVPVIVCDDCQSSAESRPGSLSCPLCKENYQTPDAAPDLIGQKRKLGLIEKDGKDLVTGQRVERKRDRQTGPSQRLFVGKIPLTVTASNLRQAFGALGVNIERIHWIVDHVTCAFYGSAFCYMSSMEDAKKAQDLGEIPLLARKSKKKKYKNNRGSCPIFVRVAYAPLGEKEIWPLDAHVETEYPPLGTCS